MTSVLVAARDAGAAAALVPVIRALSMRGDPPPVAATGRAAAVFLREEIPYFAASDIADYGRARTALTGCGVDALLTGTSLSVAADSAWWEAARGLHLPSVALVDHWHNLVERFSIIRPFDAVPDAIAVMDDAAREFLRRAAGAGPAIVSTGHPHLDELDPLRADERVHARDRLGILADQRVVLFASEPIAAHYGSTLGYTEHQAMRALQDAVALVIPSAVVILRPHPSQTAAAINDVEQLNPEARVDDRLTSREAIAAADVVAGMRSVFLLEAARLGRPAISVRPAGGADRFVDLHADEIASATTPVQLVTALRSALSSKPRPPRPRGGPAPSQAVIDLIESLVVSG